jgi:hypothetical protein
LQAKQVEQQTAAYGEAAKLKQLEQMKVMQEMKQQEAEQAALSEFYNKPEWTTEDYQKAALVLPKEQVDSILDVWKQKGVEEQKSDLTFYGNALGALKSGNIDVAKQQMMQRAAAYRNSNKEEEARQFEDLAKAIELDPVGVERALMIQGSVIPEAKGMIDNIANMNTPEKPIIQKGYIYERDPKTGAMVGKVIEGGAASKVSEDAKGIKQEMLGHINALLTNPEGVTDNFGNDRLLPNLTDAAKNAATDLNTLRGLLTLDNLKFLKGNGQISDTDMKLLMSISSGDIAETSTDKKAWAALGKLQKTLSQEISGRQTKGETDTKQQTQTTPSSQFQGFKIIR